MTVDTTAFDFSGSQGAEVAKEASKSGDFAREVEFLNLKADAASVAQGKDRALIRLLTDFKRRDPNEPITKYNLAWLTVQQHYAPTKPRPEYAKEGSNWPNKWNAVCRKDKIFAAAYGHRCFLCDQGNKPSNRTWALAVEREEVLDEQGRRIAFRDKTRQVTATDAQGNFVVESDDGRGNKTYAKKTVPAYVVLNFGWKNFFSPLNGQATYFGTILDADYLITRTGTEPNDTVYSPVRVGELTLPEGNEFGLPGGTKYDLSIPGLMEKVYPDMPDLRQIIAERTSDDYYGRWFIPGWSPPQTGNGNGQQAQQAPQQGQAVQGQAVQTPSQPAAQQEVPSDALAALQARITGASPQ